MYCVYVVCIVEEAGTYTTTPPMLPFVCEFQPPWKCGHYIYWIRFWNRIANSVVLLIFKIQVESVLVLLSTHVSRHKYDWWELYYFNKITAIQCSMRHFTFFEIANKCYPYMENYFNILRNYLKRLWAGLFYHAWLSSNVFICVTVMVMIKICFSIWLSPRNIHIQPRKRFRK